MKEDRLRIFRKMPMLRTERLLLRPMRAQDAEDMFEYSRRRDVTEFLLWSEHESIRVTKMLLSSIMNGYRHGKHMEWAIVLKENGKMIGTVGFTSIDSENSTGEIGYVINPDYKCRGIATEAAKELLALGFDYLELQRIEIRYMSENLASKRVGEKLGMKAEGTLRSSLKVKGEMRDISYSSILSGEYRKCNHKRDFSFLDSQRPYFGIFS